MIQDSSKVISIRNEKDCTEYTGIFDTFFHPFVNKFLDCCDEKMYSKVVQEYFSNKYKNLLTNIYLYSLMEYYDSSGLKYSEFGRMFIENENQYSLFFEAFPEIYDCTEICLENTLKNVAQFLYDIRLDFDIENITFIETAENDSHNGGKTNIVFKMANKTYIYKPRVAEVDLLFYNFLDLLNELGLNSSIERINVKNYTQSSLHEWIEEDENKSDPKKIYEELGKLIGVTTLLHSSDLHHENVLIKNNKLYLVDLETALTPSFGNLSIYNEHSVLKSLLLPSNFSETNNLEVAAVTATEESEIKDFHYSVYHVINKGTDQICFTKAAITLQKQRNQVLSDESYKVFDYVSDLIKGFRDSMYLFLKHKKIIKEYFSENLGSQSIRVVLRPTHVYGKLLETSYYGEISNEIHGREFFFKDVLLEKELESKIKKQVNEETKALLINDIPYFTTKINQLDLYDGEDNILIERFFKKTAEELVTNTLDRVDEHFIEEQIIQIKMSLVTSNYYKRKSKDKNFFTSEKILNSSEELLKIARNILSPFSKDEILFLSVQGDNKQILSPFNYNIYDTGGLLLTLAYAEKIKNIEKITKKMNEYYYMKGNQKGSFVEDGSHIFVKYALTKIYPDSKYLVQQYLIAKNKIKNIDNHEEIDLDFLSGHVGFCYVLWKIYEDSLDKEIYDYAKRSLRLIVQEIKKTDKHILKEMSCSLAHGLSGIILLLSTAYKFIEDKKSLNILIMELIDIEDSFFNDYYKTWITPKFNEYQNYWCYGSVGILLSRAIAFKYADIKFEKKYNQAAESVIRELKNHSFDNYSLCHGYLGALDLLELLDKLGLINNFTKKTEEYLKGNLSGSEYGEENYNFMTGLSGVIYHHFRKKNCFKNILMLDLGGEL